MDKIYEMINEKAQDHGLSCAFLEGSTDDKTHVMIINRVTKKRVNYTLIKPVKVKDRNEYVDSIINHAIKTLK